MTGIVLGQNNVTFFNIYSLINIVIRPLCTDIFCHPDVFTGEQNNYFI